MASILIADAVAHLMAPVEPGELAAVRSVAEILNNQGHRAEVVDPIFALRRFQTMVPDVLVTDVLHLADGADLVAELEAQGAARKTQVVVLVSVIAEAGGCTMHYRSMSHLIDSYVVRPYLFGMSAEQRREFRVHLAFQEQILASVGHLLRQRGKEG